MKPWTYIDVPADLLSCLHIRYVRAMQAIKLADITVEARVELGTAKRVLFNQNGILHRVAADNSNRAILAADYKDAEVFVTRILGETLAPETK